MIPRYSRKEISEIWSDQFKFQTMLDIEIEACRAYHSNGLIPSSAMKNIEERANFNIDQILEIEARTKHDVIAFLENVEQYVGPDARYIHMGITSSDINDTTFAVQLKLSSDLIISGLKELLFSLKRRAYEFKDVPCIGRTHGMHAEPMTFGVKLARFYAEFKRNLIRMEAAKQEISVCSISGPVGTFSSIQPYVQDYVANSMGLETDVISSQIISRDRHAVFFSTLSIIASSVENLAVEIRNLQRVEIAEASEYFTEGQKGSSAMPHKRNPILSENLTGLARLIRSTCTPALENMVLWHERDISHSSVERVIAPQGCILLDFALHRLNYVINTLQINEQNMMYNIKKSRGLVFSHKILVALVNAGINRSDAYLLVQRNAFRVRDEDIDFLTALKQDSEVSNILPDLERNFQLDLYNSNIDLIFDRVFVD